MQYCIILYQRRTLLSECRLTCGSQSRLIRSVSCFSILFCILSILGTQSILVPGSRSTWTWVQSLSHWVPICLQGSCLTLCMMSYFLLWHQHDSFVAGPQKVFFVVVFEEAIPSEGLCCQCQPIAMPLEVPLQACSSRLPGFSRRCCWPPGWPPESLHVHCLYSRSPASIRGLLWLSSNQWYWWHLGPTYATALYKCSQLMWCGALLPETLGFGSLALDNVAYTISLLMHSLTLLIVLTTHIMGSLSSAFVPLI